MIEIEMSRDIREFEPKIIGPLSVRQLVCVAIGAVIAIPLFMLVPGPIEIRIVLAIFLAAPAFIAGFLKLYGMPAEKFFLKVLVPNLTNPTSRKYKTKNTFEYLKGEPEHTEKDKSGKKKIMYSRVHRPIS